MKHSNLSAAKRAKNDEFYTQYDDIQKEIEAYLEYNPDTFKGKVVYCNCDDPLESNFFGFFADNFNRLGLKRLITTSFKPSPVANTLFDLSPYDLDNDMKGREKDFAARFIIDDIGDYNGDGNVNKLDLFEQLKANKNNEWKILSGDTDYPPGDFRSSECTELLKQSDIVVTNPPFSLFKEYVAQLVDQNKRFAILGNMNSITYKEIFPLIKENKIWLGVTRQGTGSMWFQVTKSMPAKEGQRIDENGIRYQTIGNSAWLTNLDHGRRHEKLSLMSTEDIIKFGTKRPFDKYDNYDALEVPLVKHIPADYGGVMGVPITFLGKYNPEQFEILGASDNGAISDKYKLPHFKKHNEPYINGKKQYKRIFIKHRKAAL